MQYCVSDWMINLLVFIDPDSTIAEALSLMRRRYIHSLLVNKSAGNPEYGIITSTDISDDIIASDTNPSHVKVRDIMTSPLITVPNTASLQECALLMKQYKIHHLPVVNDSGELVGMISATDFLVAADAMARERQAAP